MLFGVLSCYSAMALYLNSEPAKIGGIVVFIDMSFYLQETEERRLWKDFSKEFRSIATMCR